MTSTKRRLPITPHMVTRSIPKDWPKPYTLKRRPDPSLARVITDLEAGELDSLAAHIRNRRANIDPQIALTLYDLIWGGKESIGFRLSMRVHPDRSPNERSVSEQSLDALFHGRVYDFYHRLREAQPPVPAKIARFKTATEFHLTEAAVRRIIGQGRETPDYRVFGAAATRLAAP